MKHFHVWKRERWIHERPYRGRHVKVIWMAQDVCQVCGCRGPILNLNEKSPTFYPAVWKSK